MNKRFWSKVGYLWILGLVFFALRLVQLRVGFDPATGLAIPTLWGSVLAHYAAVCAVGQFLVCFFTVPGVRTDFAGAFDPPVKSVPAAAAGGMLLAAGGVLLLLSALPVRGVAAMAAGVLAVAAGGGFVLLTRQIRRGDALTVFPLLPAMFFSVFFVLAVYLPEESDPVLSRFYIPVLAAAMAAAAFSLLAAFLRQEGNLRTFTFVGNLSVMFCLAAAADGVGGDWAKAPLFLGCALVLSVFLFLSREHPVPLPEEEKPDPKAPAAEEA